MGLLIILNSYNFSRPSLRLTINSVYSEMKVFSNRLEVCEK